MGKRDKKKKRCKRPNVLWIYYESPFRDNIVSTLKKNFRVSAYERIDDVSDFGRKDFRVVIFDSIGLGPHVEKSKYYKYIPMLYAPVIESREVEVWIKYGVKRENIITEVLGQEEFAQKVLDAHKNAFKKK